MECIIPFIIAELVNKIKMRAAAWTRLLFMALFWLVMACVSLLFGMLAGKTCATASCGLARNLRNGYVL